MLGWLNWIPVAQLLSSSEEAALGANQLQSQHGAVTAAWQTKAGVTAASLLIDAATARWGVSVPWRAFGLFRTNLTPNATVRWRLGNTAEEVTTPQPPPTWDAGVVLGASTQRVGYTTDPIGGNAAVHYSATGSSSSGITATVFTPVAGMTYQTAVWARRISGAGQLGAVMRVSQDGATLVEHLANNTNFPTSPLPGAWRWISLTFTAPTASPITIGYMMNVNNGSNHAYWGSYLDPIPLYDSGTIYQSVAPGYGQAVHVAPADVTARFARLDVSDPTNTDGFLSIPLAFGGPMSKPITGLSTSSSHGRDRDETVLRSRAGQEYLTLRSTRRRWQFEFPALVADTEFWGDLQEMERAVAWGANILLVPYPGRLTQSRESIFGRLAGTADAGWTAPNSAGLRRYGGTIVERL